MSSTRVVVVGLGPAGADLVLPAALDAFARVPVRFARTARHPAIDDLAAQGITFTALDQLYDHGDDLDAVYSAIASYVVDAAHAHDEVVYAVPGSPNVAEKTVLLLRAANVEVEIVPGVSFADLAWARLGIDPLAGVRVVDARAFAIDAAGMGGPMLIAQADTMFVLSDVKLALLEVVAPDHDVTVLQRLGLPDEHISKIPLAALDREVEPDHLTSVFVDTGELTVASEFARLVALTERLRGPGGCPWDAKQTHHSLRRHVLEEAYEVAEAIEALPVDAPSGDIDLEQYDALEDELGDLLFQVVIQSVLAAEAGGFTVADVARRVHDKLVRRHPHVFGDVNVSGADEVVTNWEQIKREETGAESIVAGVTAGLPSLLAVQKLLRKADSVGLDPALDTPNLPDEEAVGRALATIVAAGKAHDVDAESALAGWARRFRERFQRMEALARARDVDLAARMPASSTRCGRRPEDSDTVRESELAEAGGTRAATEAHETGRVVGAFGRGLADSGDDAGVCVQLVAARTRVPVTRGTAGVPRLRALAVRRGRRARAGVVAGGVRPRQLQAHQPPGPAPRARELPAEPVRAEGYGRRSRVGYHQRPRRRARLGTRLRDHVAAGRSHGRSRHRRVHQHR